MRVNRSELAPAPAGRRSVAGRRKPLGNGRRGPAGCHWRLARPCLRAPAKKRTTWAHRNAQHSAALGSAAARRRFGLRRSRIRRRCHDAPRKRTCIHHAHVSIRHKPPPHMSTHRTHFAPAGQKAASCRRNPKGCRLLRYRLRRKPLGACSRRVPLTPRSPGANPKPKACRSAPTTATIPAPAARQ